MYAIVDTTKIRLPLDEWNLAIHIVMTTLVIVNIGLFFTFQYGFPNIISQWTMLCLVSCIDAWSGTTVVVRLYHMKNKIYSNKFQLFICILLPNLLLSLIISQVIFVFSQFE